MNDLLKISVNDIDHELVGCKIFFPLNLWAHNDTFLVNRVKKYQRPRRQGPALRHHTFGVFPSLKAAADAVSAACGGGS